MSDWYEEAEKARFAEGLSWRDTAIRVQRLGYLADLDLQTAMERVRRHCRSAGGYVPETPREKQKPVPPESFLQNLTPKTLDLPFSGSAKTIRFGICGDTHICGKFTQLTHLHSFYRLLSRRGVDVCYHTGDIDDGEQMRPGHQYECYRQGTDEHAEHICKVYPDDVPTFFITGNHDSSHMKRCGVDIGKAIASQRSDMTYLGRDCATVNLTPNCVMELRHPWDGTSYAISYKIQKMCDAIPGVEKPNILAVGHYHKEEQLLYRNIFCLQTACFQAQTPFERGKGISSQIGGWIIEADVDSSGTIEAIRHEFFPYMEPIREDYKNWI